MEDEEVDETAPKSVRHREGSNGVNPTWRKANFASGTSTNLLPHPKPRIHASFPSSLASPDTSLQTVDRMDVDSEINDKLADITAIS